MASANTVAQKPAGNFNPLSSFGHASPLASAAGLGWFLAGASELPAYITASATNAANRISKGLDNRIEDSWRSTTRNNADGRREIILPGLFGYLTPVARATSFQACNVLRQLESSRGAPRSFSGRRRSVVPVALPCSPPDSELALSQGWAQRLFLGRAPKPAQAAQASRLFGWPTP